MHRAAEAAIGEQTVARLEQVLQQHDAPGQPEIAVAGLAGGVDVGADMRPWRADDVEDGRRGEQQLDIDVGAGLDVMAEKADIVRQGADLKLVDEGYLRRSAAEEEQ